MSDFQRLNEMIGKLRARERPVGEVRVLSGKTPEARLNAILTEISETILPRRLSFQAKDGASLHLAVANRRLQGVLGPAGKELAVFVGKPLSDPESAEVLGLKEALLNELETNQAEHIRSKPLGQDDLGSDAGLSVDALRRAWGLIPDASDASGSDVTLDGFLADLGAKAQAWLKVDGEEIADQSGSPEDVERLNETAAYVLDAYLNKRETLFAATASPRGVAIGGASSGVFFADMAGQSAFVLTDPEMLVAVVSAWRGSFG